MLNGLNSMPFGWVDAFRLVRLLQELDLNQRPLDYESNEITNFSTLQSKYNTFNLTFPNIF